MDVTRIGVVTTPTVAHLTATEDTVDLGVMISASHNPMPDNGIKFFAHGGYKLADAVEDQIEALVNTEWERPTGDGVGEVNADHAWARESYIAHLIEATGTDLRGMKIAIDCANGAAYEFGPAVFRELVPISRSSTPSRTDATSTATPVRRTPKACRPLSSRPVVISVSPMTATRTAAWPLTMRATSSMAIRSWARCPSMPATAALSPTTHSL